MVGTDHTNNHIEMNVAVIDNEKEKQARILLEENSRPVNTADVT